jgi:hypothetical protein
VQERLDLLLTFLADQDDPGRHRALLLVGLNFDLDPASFYAAWGDDVGNPSQPASAPGSPLDAVSRSAAAVLAAYGWISYPVAAPSREGPLVPGIRVGKWRLAGPAGGRILGVKITHESERDPELAQGHLDNGQALLAAGRLAESEAAFRQALHHYYGDPRTAAQQAEALVGLADALDGQGLADEARATRVLAGELDSSVTVEDPTALATLLAPREALEIVAAETSGRVIHDRDDLEVSLLGLRRRLRLTFQLSGDPPGEILPVELSVARQGWRVAGPQWVRFGTPPSVSEARVRLLVAGDMVEPPMIVDARAHRGTTEDRQATVDFQLPLTSAATETMLEGSQTCRLSTAWLVEGKIPQVEQQSVSCPAVDNVLTGSLAMEVPADFELLALVVEHLASGAWGAEIFELDSATN